MDRERDSLFLKGGKTNIPTGKIKISFISANLAASSACSALLEPARSELEVVVFRGWGGGVEESREESLVRPWEGGDVDFGGVGGVRVAVSGEADSVAEEGVGDEAIGWVGADESRSSFAPSFTEFLTK